MRRIAAVAALVLTLCSCSPKEIAYWQHFARPVEGGPVPCGQWVGTSRVAGFTDAEIRTEHVLMQRESDCDKDAYNRSGATSLMQVLRSWASACGTTPNGLFDPLTNLRCARHVYEVQGWTAWSTYR